MHDDSLSDESEAMIGEPDTANMNGATQGAKLLDSRGFTKPPRFDGRQEH